MIFSATLIGCHQADVGGVEPKDDPTGIPQDVQDALDQLGDVQVIESTADGLPTYMIGEMARVGQIQTDDFHAASAALMPMMPPVLAPFRLTTSDLQVRSMNVDEVGGRHFRYRQFHDGTEVIGADLIVHVSVKGAVYAVNGNARGDISPALGAVAVSQAAATSTVQYDARWSGMLVGTMRSVYIETADGSMHKAYETTVNGMRGQDPVRDKVYVDVTDAHVLAVHPQIYFAENRSVYSANNGTSLPGTIKRTEGQGANADIDVNAAYDGTGATYEGYKAFWNRDSYNNAGAALVSTVHYSTNYCNAFWNSTQMVYGDGSASQGCAPLARSIDVTAHEMTHAVTENESGLVYSGESGGMNESFSDIFGNFIECWAAAGKNGTNLCNPANGTTWTVGEDVISGGLRYMYDPAKDGSSLDFWSTGAGNVDVHYSSGIGNLAFYLLSQGGTHPRGKSSINVPGVGMATAIRVFYEAQVNTITSNMKYPNIRTAMEQAAANLGLPQATRDAVSCAWAAVNVGTAPSSCGGSPPPPPPGDGVLMNNVPVSGIAGTQGQQQFWKLDVPASQSSVVFTISGGSGDADMYVQATNKPTLTSYTCRPYLNGNSETCTITAPAAGTYWVMLNGYTAFSGVTLKGVFTGGGGGGDPYLTNGVPKTGLAGAQGSNTFFRIATPAGKTLTVKINGGSGDADLYTRFGSRPTTSTWSCRPYLNGNSETCTITNTQAGDYYIMLRGFTSYSGVSLTGSF